MKPETLEKAKIDEIWLVQQSDFDSGCVFLMTLIDRRLYRLSLADGTLTQLTEFSFNRCLGVLDGYVYGSTNMPDAPYDFYRIKVDGIEMEKVE